MTQESPTSTPIPMAPLSSRVVPEHATSSQRSLTSSATASVSKTSLVITIVTTEQVPNSSVNNGGTTTTVERELKMRLTLPAAYDTKQLKSLNVKLHQDPVTNAVYPSLVQPTPYGNHCAPGYAPSSVPSFYKDPAEAQQQWQQEQLRLFQANKRDEVLPATVSSSHSNGVNTPEYTTDSSLPRPDAVSSSSSNNSTKRRRKRTTPATTTQSDSRKKRKIANNGKVNHLRPQ
mmetsp:Transcript_16348/g.40987  ORF Transcript_16348/g.40987 Transcript_16348/m.40987 type:complete len:232 (+) Transcript_16348:91-786(+)|eukprot:CAMPEP_0116096360 /NCGR_PEP_ID=MMETSP0327-20121206/10141_1 /TAXON_ID=44447 /ORGANISM="Pseudo-nitzschia delicatissima, Strain B596" /LENGTH=231 /DNA_ID=CAMNT_0003588061 /DNA_START=70 /DNA_END=765 /DNA_ORIENTATION=-